MRYNIDTAALLDFLVGLLNIPSPTGFHEQAIAYCERAFASLPLALSRSRKGALVGIWDGEHPEEPRGITAHVDTLGAMVAAIKSSGRLRLTPIGSWAWGSVEGEGVTVFCRSGKTVRGAILPVKASVHIFGPDARTFKRDDEEYEVRLDARVESADGVREIGIEVGDFVAFDPRVETGGDGFIRSRHLDDKAGVACVYAALKAIADAGLQPARRTSIHISNYEEVGHGAAGGWPGELAELLTVDMAAVGGMQNSSEYAVGICAKDSGGPYHIALTRRLAALAEAASIPFRFDIYPYYGSDGEAYWRAGGDVAVALIGPGVDASHHYERTHLDSLQATTLLIGEYLLSR